MESRGKLRATCVLEEVRPDGTVHTGPQTAGIGAVHATTVLHDQQAVADATLTPATYTTPPEAERTG